MKLLMEIVEADGKEIGPTVESRGLIKKGAYFISCSVVSLRGV